MDVGRLCVLIAKDPLTRGTLLERLAAEKLSSDQDKTNGFVKVDGSRVDAYETLLRAISSPPMFAGFQLLAFEGLPLVGGRSSGVQDWKNALSALPSRTMVVFLLKEPASEHPLFPFLMESSSVIEGDRFQKTLWGAWLKAILKELGGSVSPETKRFLWENYRYDTLQAGFELEKILLSGREEPLAPPRPQSFDAFDTLRLFERGDLAAGFKATQALYRGVGSPFSVIGAVVWKIRQNANHPSLNDRLLLQGASDLDVRLKSTKLPKAIAVEMFLMGLLKGRS